MKNWKKSLFNVFFYVLIYFMYVYYYSYIHKKYNNEKNIIIKTNDSNDSLVGKRTENFRILPCNNLKRRVTIAGLFWLQNSSLHCQYSCHQRTFHIQATPIFANLWAVSSHPGSPESSRNPGYHFLRAMRNVSQKSIAIYYHLISHPTQTCLLFSPTLLTGLPLDNISSSVVWPSLA